MTLAMEKSDVIYFPPRRCRWYQYLPSEGKGKAKIRKCFNIDKFCSKNPNNRKLILKNNTLWHGEKQIMTG